ncbi:hypothetical protein [Thorsellia anophelis]|uniref:Uncharacterized protein n=1 Tax=Thorsellia anophelis DSM 18579 TaxID=1123402 RepID=A0A1I0FQD6_9GAMM|nr:hypothetical protein [Thorsellia anophelis]SET59549.1 hypothetical protein SAMN02583745_02826 [Thorsellia anophelis DSM 18579]
MNRALKDLIIVRDLASDIIKISVSDTDLIYEMQLLGFIHNNEFMELKIVSEEDKVNIIKKLISKDALFLSGVGWYPSEVLEYLTDKGIQIPQYKVIHWKNPENFYIETK